MPRIDEETVQRILDAADIVEVVSDFVKLRRSGANYKGLCPFHNERTPSFSVNKARNICKCFSCGKGGSPVNFIMEHEQMSYQEALRYLARKYNIEIREREQTDAERQAQSRREALYAANAFALKHFEENLADTPDGRDIAMAYIRHRGISPAMVQRFHLGYAIDRGNELLEAARQAGFSDEILVDTGLEVRSERDGALYDRYRGRVIFPIHTLSGRVVGFGARTMRSDKNIAKYVNSPESDIYHKKLELYGLYQARSAIGRRDKCIMVEGYLDVISMHQAGVENVVASSGTSLTVEQARVIHRFTNNVTLIYDADAAGIKASMRGIKILLAEKMDVRVLALPPGDDPDSFAQSHSASEVEKYLAENEVDIISFMVSKYMAGVSPNDPIGRAKVINEVLDTIAYVDEPVKRQEYISQCSRLLQVAEEVLIKQLNIFITKRYEEASKAAAREHARQTLQQEPSENSEHSESSENSEHSENSQAPAQAVPLLALDANRLRPYEENLARYIVRYGLMDIADMAEADGNTSEGTVIDIIDNEMALDGLSFTCPQYAAVAQVVRDLRRGPWPEAHRQRLAELQAEAQAIVERHREEFRRRGGTIDDMQKSEAIAAEEARTHVTKAINDFDTDYARSRLVNHDDDTVRRTAGDLILDRYELSKIFAKQGNIETEEEQLPVLVPRAVNELRSAIVGAKVRELTQRLATLPPDDTEALSETMSELTQWLNAQKEYGKVLGERIILPRSF